MSKRKDKEKVDIKPDPTLKDIITKAEDNTGKEKTTNSKTIKKANK